MQYSGPPHGENADGALKSGIRRVLLAQAVIALVLAGCSWFVSGAPAALSIGYGALLGLMSALVTGRSVMRSSESAVSRPNLALLPVYSGMLQKLLIAALGVGIGIKLLNLQPVFMLSGLLASQMAYVFAVRRAPT